MNFPVAKTRPGGQQIPLLLLGLVAFAVAALSIVDMYVPRAYDGVVLGGGDRSSRLRIDGVVPHSAADDAGLREGDEILGIARTTLRSRWDAARLMNDLEPGETVAYFVRQDGVLREIEVTLGTRTIGDPLFLYASLLGFLFFFVGLWVLVNRPDLPPSRRFFVLCCLFLLFLVCRLRPASYSWVDIFTVTTGTAALMFLPAAFLHFFLMFPAPVWEIRNGPVSRLLRHRVVRYVLLAAMWIAPPLIWIGSLNLDPHQARLFGSPQASWLTLGGSILLGLVATAINARTLPPSRQRQGSIIVFFTALIGLVPFVALGIVLSSVLRNERLIFLGLLPLLLFPLGFGYAIIRFQVFDLRVILRKSLLYTATTAIVTVFYAVGIATMNALFRGTEIADSPYFPVIFALAIVLLFEPLRRRIQIPVDRFFMAQRSRLQDALLEMGATMSATRDPGSLAGDLVERLPQILGLEFAALYLVRQDRLERAAGPEELPGSIPCDDDLHAFLQRHDSIARIDEPLMLAIDKTSIGHTLQTLSAAGVELIGDLASAGRPVGMILLSRVREGELPIEPEEIDLLRGLLAQAAMAIETSRLLEDRARQAELERELEIAAAIQASLLPSSVRLGPGWEVAAVCRPAQQVGGDFFSELPSADPDARAVIYGDVSGKSVSGALMMMAAKEALHTLALTHTDPESLFKAANDRLYELGKRSFVALGYFVPAPRDGCLRYVIAGQPQPLRIRRDERVDELPFDEHRLPLGAMSNNGHRHIPLEVDLDPGEIILAYSDGVIEAQSPAGDFFGTQRLMQIVAGSRRNPQELIHHVLEQLDSFTAGLPQYDDVTLMAIARSGGHDA